MTADLQPFMRKLVNGQSLRRARAETRSSIEVISSRAEDCGGT